MIDAVLFDLDGTLADTAPDLGGALNRLLEEEDRPSLPPATLRPYVSGGTRGLLKLGLQVAPGDPAYAELARRFLVHYEQNLCTGTRLFPGMAELLDALEARGTKWGIVTNKPQRFTLPLVERLGLHRRAACVISGDSAAHPKPDPAPLFLACEVAGIEARTTAYVGDDIRDIVAGQAAGMRTITAAYGYLGVDVPYDAWRADAIVNGPMEILNLLGTTC
jgi:2-phosphoglycolate phosphatase